MFAVSPTDKNWFDFLKYSGLNSFVNFWTPTPWNIKQLNVGNRLYFMLKSPIRKIGGLSNGWCPHQPSVSFGEDTNR